MKVRTAQQPLPFRPHGGPRKGAGRKPADPRRSRVSHGARPVTKSRYPVHVTVRVRREVTRLRRFELCKVLQRAFVHGCRAGEFRICQFSIQGNHIHLICEASTSTALARGVQGWSVRVARGLNGYLGRKGTVFDDRYHVEVITTPTQTRNALCYVMLNARRHGEPLDPAYNGMDPFSSAWWFDGWKDESWKVGIGPPEQRPVAEAQSWLLTTGWRQASAGLIEITEVPAAARRATGRAERAGSR
jgi:REP element-mobilizing transposase RayT